AGYPRGHRHACDHDAEPPSGVGSMVARLAHRPGAGVVAFGLFVAALASAAGADQSALASLLKTLDLRGYTSRTAPPQFSGTTLDARQLSTAEHRGSVIVLNFWASWCLECRSEMPVLERVQREFSSRAGVALRNRCPQGPADPRAARRWPRRRCVEVPAPS